MDISIFKEFASLISTLLAIGAIIYTWLTAKSKSNATQLAKVEKDQLDIKSRVERVENELVHLPQKDDVQELKLSLVRLEGTVKEHAAISNGTAHAVQRLDEFLRKAGKQ